MVDSVSCRRGLKNARVKKVALNIRIQWNAGTACVSECVLKTLVDVSDIFYFFLLGGGEGRVWGAGRGGRTIFHWKSQEGGGGSPRRVGAGGRGRGREGVCGEWGGGGAKYFFRGRNAHRETLACRGLRVGPSKALCNTGHFLSQAESVGGGPFSAAETRGGGGA